VLLLLLLGLLLSEPEGVGVATTRGSLHWYKGSLHVTFLPTNKVEIFGQVSKALPPFLFLSLFLSLLKLFKKKKKTKTLQRSIGQGCSVLLAITASYNVAGPAPRVGMLLAIAAAASYNPLPASPQKRATTLCRPRHSSEL